MLWNTMNNGGINKLLYHFAVLGVYHGHARWRYNEFNLRCYERVA
jgi:hypothetical protein